MLVNGAWPLSPLLVKDILLDSGKLYFFREFS